MEDFNVYAEIEYDDPNGDYNVIMDSSFVDLIARLKESRKRGFDSYCGSVPNLRVLSIGVDNKRDDKLTEIAKKELNKVEFEGSEDALETDKLNSASSFVRPLPSEFIRDSVKLIESLWVFTDTTKTQDCEDMKNSLEVIGEKVGLWQTVYTEEIEQVKRGQNEKK